MISPIGSYLVPPGVITVETAYSDGGHSDQLLIWIKKLGTE